MPNPIRLLLTMPVLSVVPGESALVPEEPTLKLPAHCRQAILT
jgi:hypothetical protein